MCYNYFMLFDDLRSNNPEVALSLSVKDCIITLNKIIVTGNNNQGLGTSAMIDLVELADQNNMTIVLSPSDFLGSSVRRLIKFYKRFGFVENKGGSKDYFYSETMYRLPK